MKIIIAALHASLTFFVFGMIFVFVASSFDTLSGTYFQISSNLERATQNVNIAALYSASLNPNMRYIALSPGLHKEQMAEIFKHRLDWTDQEVSEFTEAQICSILPIEGYLFPSVYVVRESAKPTDIKLMMQQRKYLLSL